MNKKYITCIVFLMFMSFAFIPSVESAVAYTTLEDWESYNLGVSHSVEPDSNTLFSWNTYAGDDGTIALIDHYDTGTKSLLIDGTDSNYEKIRFNLSKDYNYINSISICFYFDGISHATTTNPMIFYNDTGAVLKINWKNTGGGGIDFQCVDSTDTGYKFADVVNTGHNYFLNITHLNTNLMNYSVEQEGGADMGMTDQGSYSTFDWSNITYFTFETFSLGGFKLYFDDIVYSTQTQVSEDECEYIYMTDRYSYIGNIDSSCSRPSDKKTIETRYNVPVKMNITGVDLAIPTDQYNDDPDLSNYFLTFNGLDVETPQCFIEYSYYYVLRWELDVELTNEIPLMEFTHSQKTSWGRYWFFMIGCYSSIDLDNDGEVNYKESTTADGTYNGQLWAYDLAYQLYYEDIQFPDDETYFDNDYIYIINKTHYCGEPVGLTYTLSTMASDTHLRIWNDDTAVEVNDVSFPYLCPTTSETIGFIAETSANYTAKLYRNSVELDNVSFFVNDFKNPANYVYTMPNPCFEGESYLVKYAFDNTEGYDGAIFLSSTPDYRNYYEIHYVLDSTSGSYTQMQNAPCTLYYIMAVNKNGTYYVVDNGIHPHTVKSKSMKNYFTLGSSHLTLQDGETRQSIYGETTHVGGNCKIYDNGKLVYTITESPFTEFYKITTAGNHKVEMRLITNETTVLFTQNYTVSGISEDEYIEDTSYIVRDWAYDLYGDFGVFLLGVGVVLGFMFIPFALVLYVNVSFNKNIALGDLHWSIYLIFAIIGVIVDVQLHLAEQWIILLMCVVSIAIAVLSWNGNR